ncbi:phosphotransferase [Halobium salinum]|uniref:Phosphotransferase n=1 Tax=Halobium salinum TaxID=1364940 RepID=A0ABD5PE44_9EURY|nr:phosphotransferase [Halobium salinum]
MTEQSTETGVAPPVTDPGAALDRRVRAVDRAELTPVVRTVVGDAAATVTKWYRDRMRAGAGGGYGGTAIWRFAGVAALDDGSETAWTVVLKTVAERVWERPTDPAYWRREAEVYRSGVAADAPGLAMPRCYAVRIFEGEGCWLWLEDLAEGAVRGPADTLASRRAAAVERPGAESRSRGRRTGATRGSDETEGEAHWTLEDFTVVASDLGRFNAHFAHHPVEPRPDWLTVRAFDFRQTAPTVALVDSLPDDDLVREAFPGEQADRLLDAWHARDTLLARRRDLPTTLCHFDAYPRNLFLRPSEDGPQTVAVDWDQLADGAVGENAAALVMLSLVWADFDPRRGERLADVVFDAYLDGLREGGWEGDSEDVRAGFDVHLVLRWLEFVGRHVRCLADPTIHEWLSELMGRPVTEMREVLPEINRLAFGRFAAVEAAGR